MLQSKRNLLSATKSYSGFVCASAQGSGDLFPHCFHLSKPRDQANQIAFGTGATASQGRQQIQDVLL
jgi:hypothetical protein